MEKYHDEVRILQELLDEELISEYFLRTVVDICLLRAAGELHITENKSEFCKRVREAAERGEF